MSRSGNKSTLPTDRFRIQYFASFDPKQLGQLGNTRLTHSELNVFFDSLRYQCYVE